MLFFCLLLWIFLFVLFFDLFYTYKCQYTAILGLDFLIENCAIDILVLCRLCDQFLCL